MNTVGEEEKKYLDGIHVNNASGVVPEKNVYNAPCV